MQDKTGDISKSQDSHNTLSAKREELSKEIDDLRCRRTKLEEGQPSPLQLISAILAIVAIALAIIFYFLANR